MPITRHRPTRRRGRRRGSALVEVAVATIVLTVGVLGAVGVLTVAARDARRARARHAAVAMLTARVERWRAAPCAPTGGEARVGAFVESWQARGNGMLATLVDTVTFEAGTQRAGVVAVTWCTP